MAEPQPAPPAHVPGPLAGLTVLDFSTMMAGPYCTRMMADLGATVIKVESPEGDHMRKLRPRKSGSSRFFGQLNVGKRSVTLDLSAEPGREAALALVARADIVLESWRPGVAARLGLAYEACRAVREDVIYCSISGWGQSGPNARRAAFAPVVHAASGLRHGQPLLPAARQHPAGDRRVRRRHPRRHDGVRRDPGRPAQAGRYRCGVAHRLVTGGGDAVHAGL